ncbi:MAG: hypothetical protein ABI645_04960 [Pseudomonadota bacterium]
MTAGSSMLARIRNIPPQRVALVAELFDNSAARVFLEGTCTECQEARVFENRKDVNGWRALVLDTRKRGASISDENIEQSVEWLARVQGTNPVE